MMYFRWWCVILVAICAQANAQSFTPVDEKSSISFTVKNFGLNVNGTFSHLKGTIIFDDKNLKNSYFDVSVESATLNTGIDLRDKHIKKEEYLDVSRYAEISFKSTEITSGEKPGSYFVKGDLMIKDVTREIQFPFTADLRGDGITLTGKFNLNRRDYNVGGRSISMSETVDVVIQVFALKTSTTSTNSR